MRKIEDIDVLTDEGLQGKILLLSAVVLVAGTVVAALMFVAGAGDALGTLAWWLALVGVSAAALPVHELVHAAAFKLFAPGCHVRFGYASGMLYAGCPGTVLSRARMVAVLLAPSVVVTAALVALALAWESPVLAVLLAAIHLSGCAGDLLMARTALITPGCTHVEDTETGIALLAAE